MLVFNNKKIIIKRKKKLVGKCFMFLNSLATVSAWVPREADSENLVRMQGCVRRSSRT